MLLLLKDLEVSLRGREAERKERQNLENSTCDPGEQQLSIYPRLLSKNLGARKKKKK